MKTKLLAVLLFAFASTSVFAKEMNEKEMMEKWKAASAPGAPHEVLKNLKGKWKYTSKWWDKKDAPAPKEEAKGTANMKMIFGDRYLQYEIKGKSMGMPFEGLGIVGYNNIEKKYETVWLDNMSTAIMHGTGEYDDANKILKDKGEFSCPMSDKKLDYRSEWKIVDKNKLIYSMYGEGPQQDGEFKSMEIVFTR